MAMRFAKWPVSSLKTQTRARPESMLSQQALARVHTLLPGLPLPRRRRQIAPNYPFFLHAGDAADCEGSLNVEPVLREG
jgi:hypothetical protein